MAIIKYTVEVGQSVPSWVFDPGHFTHPTPVSDDPLTVESVGIGLGGGTVLTHAEFLTYVQSIHALITFTTQVDPDARDNPVEMRAMTDAEVETMVSDWCIDKGHTNPDGR